MRFLLRSASLFFSAALVVCFAPQSIYTQTSERNQSRFKLDEYGTIGQCDHSARLDNFAITLQNQTDATGSVVYYGPKEPGEGTLEAIKNYLVHSRGIAEERFKTFYAGPNDDLKQPRIQLWVLPQQETLPPFENYKNDLDTFTGLYDENPRWDGMYFGEGEGTGPPVYGVSLISFAQMLKTRPDTVAYVVAFNGRKDAPRAWKRVADQELKWLRETGIDASRVKVIYGGEAKETKIQEWILNKDQPAPVIAEAESLPAKAVSLQRLTEWELSDESERWSFDSLLDVLRTSPSLRVVFVVHIEPVEEAENAEPVQQIIEPVDLESPADSIIPEPESGDLLKLVEKWKAQLIEAQKIPYNRVIVLFAKPREDEGSYVETWIAPVGAALPDPDAEPEEDKEESPGSTGKDEPPASG